MPEQSLHERLGGVNAIAMVVDRFSDKIVENPKLNMNEAHKDLHITPGEFAEVGAEIGYALDHFGVPEREKQELLAAVVAHKTEVANPPR